MCEMALPVKRLTEEAEAEAAAVVAEAAAVAAVAAAARGLRKVTTT